MTLHDAYAAYALPRPSYIAVDEEKLLGQAKRLKSDLGYEAPAEEIAQALFALIEQDVLVSQEAFFWPGEECWRQKRLERELDEIAARRDKPCKCIHFAGDLSCCPRHGVAIEDAPEVVE